MNLEVIDFDSQSSQAFEANNPKNQNALKILKVESALEKKEKPPREQKIESQPQVQSASKNQILMDEQDIEARAEEEDVNKIVRVEQNFCLYIITVVCTLLTGTQNIIIFITNIFKSQLACILFLPLVVTRILFYLMMSKKLCENWSVIFKLYFTIDKIFLTEIVQIVSVTCYVSIFFPHAEDLKWFYALYAIIYPIMLFSMTGYFRIMMVYCNWKPCQVIVYKISLMLGAVSFFGIGIFYTVKEVAFTDGENPKIDKLIKDIIFLYIFAGFELFNEIFSKVDDIDGTATFKGGYKLQCDDDDMQMLLRGISQQPESNVENQEEIERKNEEKENKDQKKQKMDYILEESRRQQSVNEP